MAAASSSFGDRIREQLTCSICLELLTRPKELPCQHTFCQDCLEVHAGKEGSFECPKCRQQTTMPGQGVAGLPDNSMAASMCETFQQQKTLPTSPQQSGQKRSLHDSHTTTMKKAAQERSPRVQAWITEGRNILGSYSSFITGLGETEKTLNTKKQETDNGINQAFNQMVEKLTQRRDELLSEAEQDHRENLEEIQVVRNSLSASVNELSAACDRAEQDSAEGVLELSGVVGKYRGTPAPTPVQTQPAVFQPTDTPVPVLGHVEAGGTGNQEQQPQRVTFGGRGSGQGQFQDPAGVAVSDKGEIFVADRGNKRIQVFTLQGLFVRQFPTDRIKPTDVALDGEGNLWVVGWTESAQFVAQQYKYQWGRYDTQRTISLKKGGGRGVAVDTRSNHILLTQTTQHGGELQGTVKVFRPDGTLVRTVGGKYSRYYGDFEDPYSITVDREGRVLVSDREKDLVFAYDENGQSLFQFGDRDRYTPGSRLSKPCGICTDMAGNIIVADSGNGVKMFDRKKEFLKHVAQDLGRLCAVAMATEGQLVVASGGTDTVTIINRPDLEQPPPVESPLAALRLLRHI
ncbi:hypothetical protein Bbelb_096560 [Branchiostoma belcheri]|nr:hypothetical protein Bbelb_096560 [Branchiostoma belcheri]